MGELADSFDTLADSDTWYDTSILFGAHLPSDIRLNVYVKVPYEVRSTPPPNAKPPVRPHS